MTCLWTLRRQRTWFFTTEKKLILGLLSTSFFQPIVSTCYSLNLKTIARMRVELYGRLFLKHRNISRHGQKMSNSGTDSVMISWSPSRHGGERENQIDFGNKIFVFLSSWKIDAGCIYDGMQWACWSALNHVLPLAIEQNEVNANMIMVIICFDRELPYLSLRYARYHLGHLN